MVHRKNSYSIVRFKIKRLIKQKKKKLFYERLHFYLKKNDKMANFPYKST